MNTSFATYTKFSPVPVHINIGLTESMTDKHLYYRKINNSK